MPLQERFQEIPLDALIPLSKAHLLIGKSKATVYRWSQKPGMLTTTETPDGQKVTLQALLSAESKVRHGGPRIASKNG